MSKKFFEINGSETDVAKVIAVCVTLGVEIKAVDEVKASTTKKAPSEKKDDDNFPRAKYTAMAKELGCLSKKGTCWNSCRDIVYDAIGWDKVNSVECKPKMTKAQAKKAVDKIKKDKGWS